MTTALEHMDQASARHRENGAILIQGRVREPLILSMEALSRMASEELRDFPIFCGTGDPKGAIESCRGVLLENVIRLVEVIREGENDTKRMFIMVSAEDGYRVVFSWHEIFNTPIGGGVMILFEMNGNLLNGANGGPALISVEDYFTGSRYVKRLRTIHLMRAE